MKSAQKVTVGKLRDAAKSLRRSELHVLPDSDATDLGQGRGTCDLTSSHIILD